MVATWCLLLLGVVVVIARSEPSRPSLERVVRHLVWDWNGTLFDDLAAVVAATSDSFVAIGHLPMTVEQYRAQFTRPIQDFYRKVLGRPLDDAEWRGRGPGVYLPS